jgi:hypothetical protein
MSWSGRLSLGFLLASIVACVLGLAIGPEFLFQKLDETWVTAWKSVGDSIIRHDLAALSRQLDEERALVSRMRMRRNALMTRLQDLELRSFPDRIARLPGCRRGSSVLVVDRPWDGVDHAQGSDCPSRQCPENDRESARMDRALASIAAEINCVDHQLETVERALRAKERHLFVLEAMTEAHQIRQELAGSGDPLSWSARAGRVSVFLQPSDVTPSD